MLTLQGDVGDLTQTEIAWLMIGGAARELAALAESPMSERDMGMLRTALRDIERAGVVLG